MNRLPRPVSSIAAHAAEIDDRDHFAWRHPKNCSPSPTEPAGGPRNSPAKLRGEERLDGGAALGCCPRSPRTACSPPSLRIVSRWAGVVVMACAAPRAARCASASETCVLEIPTGWAGSKPDRRRSRSRSAGRPAASGRFVRRHLSQPLGRQAFDGIAVDGWRRSQWSSIIRPCRAIYADRSTRAWPSASQSS